MTGNEMITTLGLRLEDPAGSVFTSATIVEALNTAQRTVVNTIHNNYLAELQSIEGDKNPSTGTAGQMTYAAASVAPIRNGIVGIYDDTNDKWCTMIEPGEIKGQENSYLSGDTSAPVAWTFGESIYVRPTTIALIDIWYIKAPTALAASGSECDLNISLQEILLDFAEAQLWRMDAKAERGNVAYSNAMNMVKILNERYAVDRISGIGALGR